MLETCCVSVFEYMISSKSCMMNESHVPKTHWKWNCNFTSGLKSYKTKMICVLLFLCTFALVFSSLVWRVLALNLGNKNVSAGWNFSWCCTVTAVFADRIAGRILQVQKQGVLIFDTSWWSIPASLNFILE